MQPSNFDELTKALATSTSRRHALRLIVTTSIGGLLGIGGISTAFGRHNRPRRISPASGGQRSNKNCAQFCAAVFGPNTSAAGQCTSDAAHGRGLCFTCGNVAPSSICCVRNTSGYCNGTSAATCCSGATPFCCGGTCSQCCSNSNCTNGNTCSGSHVCVCGSGLACTGNTTCVGGSCCPNANVCGPSGSETCCASGQSCCGSVCCPSAQTCCLSVCCPSGQTCTEEGCCPQNCGGHCCGLNQFCCGDTCCNNDQTCCGSANICCPSGQICCGGICQECCADTDCTPQHCCNGTCADCCVDADCPSPQGCVHSICNPCYRDGTPCSNSSLCCSGFCNNRSGNCD